MLERSGLSVAIVAAVAFVMCFFIVGIEGHKWKKEEQASANIEEAMDP